MPQNQPLSRYNVTLYHEETRERLTVGTIASSPEEAKKWAQFNAALMLKEWMMSRTLVIAATLAMLLLASCTSSTGPSTQLTCEQRFDRAIENDKPYLEALDALIRCIEARGDVFYPQARNY